MLDEAPERRPAAAAAGPQDADLLQAVVGGRRDALGDLYDRHGPRLLALAVALVNDQSMAESLVHDAFLLAWHRARAFDPARTTVAAWLTGRLLDCVKAHCTPQQRAQAAQALRAMIRQTGGRP